MRRSPTDLIRHHEEKAAKLKDLERLRATLKLNDEASRCRAAELAIAKVLRVWTGDFEGAGYRHLVEAASALNGRIVEIAHNRQG